MEVVLLYTFPTAPLMRMVTLLSIVTLSDGTVMNAGKCKGEDGANGSNGKSAYEMWIDAGNTGTEEDFLNSLKGEKGDTGETGATGADGKDGEQRT